MRKIFLILIVLSLNHFSSIAQSWYWSRQIGGTSSDFVTASCIDNSSNIYLCGEMQSSNFFFGNDSLQCNGFDDCFLLKYNSSGLAVWGINFGGSNSFPNGEVVNGIAYDFSANTICITGVFFGTCILGSDTLNSDAEDFFIAKFDTSGDCLWAKKAGGPNNDGATAITINSSGEIIVAGNFNSALTIDTVMVQSGSSLLKFDENGNCLWAHKIFNANGNGYDGFFARLKTKGENIFGFGSCEVDSFVVDTTEVKTNFISGQYILAKFDSSGHSQWITPCAGSGINSGFGLTIDDVGSCYITGQFSGVAIFQDDTIYNSHSSDLFIAKYNPSGEVMWVSQGHSSNFAIGKSLAVSPSNNFYLTGAFSDTISFDNDTIVGSGAVNLLLLRFDSTGSFIGLKDVINTAGECVDVDNAGLVYLTGGLFGTTAFGSNQPISNLGLNNIFVAKSDAITGENVLEKTNNSLVIYANPNQGKCTINIPDYLKKDKNLSLTIYDNAGRIIQQRSIIRNEEKVSINLEAQPKGIYNVTLGNKNRIYSGKIIFE
jgi:hypothetical protein